MRRWASLVLTLVSLTAWGEQGTARLWGEFKAKRESLGRYHQEFELLETSIIGKDEHKRHRDLLLDVSGLTWREITKSGSGDDIRIFDGDNLFSVDSEGDEYVRLQGKSKDDIASPTVYDQSNLDWTKAKELSRRPCGFAKNDHTCAILEVPLKPSARVGQSNHIIRRFGGVSHLAIDTETGLVIGTNSIETVDNGYISFQLNRIFVLKKMSYGSAPDPARFLLPPSATHEVKEFTKWDANRINKHLAGQPAPDLDVTDLQGNRVSLTALRGKTVLLDFWTTWCPPCRADAPILDKLYSKYSGKDLMIVGVSVDEERAIVKKFLESHAHTFPIVLTSENDMPHAYQVGLFPTYIVIAPDGTVSSAFEGDRGFSDLRKHLQKAGMQID